MLKVCFGQEQKELLAAVAAETIYVANIRGNRQRERAQDFIACRMTMAIVDVLEMIEIDDGDGERTARSVYPPDFLVEFFKNVTAVECARQLIRIGEFRKRIVE